MNLENLYISPLELCNLACLYCYTNKTKSILSNDQILDFIKNYQQVLSDDSIFVEEVSVGQKGLSLKSVIFCGGEVFTLKDFPSLINQVQSQQIFVSVITNGTVDRLTEIAEPHNCQLIVSFDGPVDVHDANRGKGNYQKSLNFVRHALDLGFPVEIFFLVTRYSYPFIDTFPEIFRTNLDHPRSSSLHFTYLVDRLGSLKLQEVRHVRQKFDCYPPKNFGCNIFSLQSNGKFYGCCESRRPLGSLADPLEDVVKKYLEIITQHPNCSDPKYHCNL